MFIKYHHPGRLPGTSSKIEALALACKYRESFEDGGHIGLAIYINVITIYM